MTEWYHTSPYYGGEQSVTYRTNGSAIQSAWLWIDEFSVSQRGPGSSLFNNYTNSSITFTNSSQLQSLSSNGANVAANATQFITGYAPNVVLNLAYSVTGGTSVPSAPVLTYTLGGVQQTTTLTQSSQTFSADTGTSWSITNPLSSSTSTERWLTNQVTSGTATSAQTIDFVFYHQYYVATNLDPVAGGSISVISGWYDAGASFQTLASSNSGWQFESWSGSGQGSYSGDNNSALAFVNTPLTETATFYPGLTITASSKVSISYVYGSTAASIPSNTTKTIYAPSGTEIKLTAKPNLFIYSFGRCRFSG